MRNNVHEFTLGHILNIRVVKEKPNMEKNQILMLKAIMDLNKCDGRFSQ